MNDQISKMLKLKRLETPGEEYFEAFLPEFQRYQRAEILEEPSGWQRAWAGLAEAFSMTPRPVLVTAAACAAVMIIAFAGRLQLGAEKGSSQPALVQADQVIDTPAPFEEIDFTEENYTDPLLQQPEIQTVSLSERRDLSSPRYVTGETFGPYETSLSF